MSEVNNDEVSNAEEFCLRNQINDARYDPLHNVCWFDVVCGPRDSSHEGQGGSQKTVAKFRLHFDEDICWNFFKLLNCQVLHPVNRANTTFSYGSEKKLPEIKTGKKIELSLKEIPQEFAWLEEFLAQSKREPISPWLEQFFKEAHEKNPKTISANWCHYYGVDFYELDE